MKKVKPFLIAYLALFLIGGLIAGTRYIYASSHNELAPMAIEAAMASPTPTMDAPMATQTPSAKPSSKASKKAKGMSGDMSSMNWIPAAFTVLGLNPNFAQDTAVTPPCTGNSSNGAYCWTYKLVSKTSCTSVKGSLHLINSGSTVATVYGKTGPVRAGHAFVLEIDSGSGNDMVVNETTTGDLVSVTCRN